MFKFLAMEGRKVTRIEVMGQSTEACVDIKLPMSLLSSRILKARGITMNPSGKKFVKKLYAGPNRDIVGTCSLQTWVNGRVALVRYIVVDNLQEDVIINLE